jgi:hypothetical protein
MAEADAPWWRTALLAGDFGDIKDLWEPARFGWIYDLVRGYLISGDDRFIRAFEERFESWLKSSPPFRGPHWSCGQETAIRAAALLYAEANLAGTSGASPEVWAQVRRVLAASGERIADAIGYAISQRNNHAISEAAGLVLLGVRFRTAHPEAKRWLRRGRALLDRLIAEQFEPDGWYIQHSFTYLRVALDQCVLAERALRSIGAGLSSTSVARLRAAAELLLAVIDPETGRVPNHGANDGAFVHPITLAEYRDFRPVLTAVCALWGHALPAGIAPDHEVLAWLGVEPPPTAPPLEDGVRSGVSGWAAARLGRTVVFLRAGRYSARPGHVDPLHLDVCLGGRELVVDPGTFAYNAPPPWRNGLAGADVHNGPVVDGVEPGVRGPRFLWLIWPEAELVTASFQGGKGTLVARVPGSHERRVSVVADRVVVEDRALRAGSRDLRVRWLLHPDADRAAVEITNGVAASVAATEDSTAGWFSQHYGDRVASTLVEARQDLPAPEPLRTEFNLRAKGADIDRSAPAEEPACIPSES